MGELRDRLAELPRDQVVDVSCTVGAAGDCEAGGENCILRLSRPRAEWLQGQTASGRVVHVSDASQGEVACLLE